MCERNFKIYVVQDKWKFIDYRIINNYYSIDIIIKNFIKNYSIMVWFEYRICVNKHVNEILISLDYIF